MPQKKIIVVGGGPAGMMAAIRAGQLGAEVTLIEKNSNLGKKLLLTGKGRCNLTNACDLEDFLTSFTTSAQFLRDAFKLFFNRELMEFFESRGLKLKVERQQRVFPETDRSSSILQVLKAELQKLQVKVFLNSGVRNLSVAEDCAQGVILSDGKELRADAVILATGGISYAFTGSTGEGLKIADNLGHKLVSLRAGLVPLVTEEKFPAQIRGLALKNIRLRFSDGKRKILSDIGEMIFTDFGISGPLVLSLSSAVSLWLAEGKKVTVEIDLKPALSLEQIEARFLREFAAQPKIFIKNLLKDFLPTSLIEVFLELANVSPEQPANQIKQDERKRMAAALKGFPLHIQTTLPIEEAMVTIGGISLKEINPRTMESRKVSGLYFAGEMIDVDGDTGGYNLQAAFSTGYLAGASAAGD